MMEITIEKMSPQDRDEIISIFSEGVQSGDLVLDTDNPGTYDMMAGRNLVARAEGRIIGWAAVEPAGDLPRSRTASVSVFVKPGYRRLGIGRSLLNAAIDLAASNGISTLVSGIVPKNVPALLLHKTCGFYAFRMLRKAGLASGQWQNVVLLQRDCR
jgi:L-amino acid N-acyltransferase YncA